MYYSGHGLMDTTTKILCNSEDTKFAYYPMESKLSNLAGYKNTYVVGIFDCCREKMPKEAMRGGGDQEEDQPGSDFYCTFGCPPESGVKAKSTLVESYTDCVYDALEECGGVLTITSALEFLKGREPKSESRNNTTHRLYFDVTVGRKKPKLISATPDES